MGGAAVAGVDAGQAILVDVESWWTLLCRTFRLAERKPASRAPDWSPSRMNVLEVRCVYSAQEGAVAGQQQRARAELGVCAGLQEAHLYPKICMPRSAMMKMKTRSRSER